MSTQAVPGPGAAGWILATGAALSLHVMVMAVLILVLATPPEAPSEASGGIVIRNISPVTATAPPGARRTAPAAAPERRDPTAQRPPALAPDSPRRAAMLARPGPADREEVPRPGTAPQQTAPDGQAAPRRITATTGAPRAEPRSEAPRRVVSGAQPPPSAAQGPTPRRLAATGRARRAERSEGPSEARSEIRSRAQPAARSRPGPALESTPRRVGATRQTPPAERAGASRRIIPADGARAVSAATAPRRIAPGGQGTRAEPQQAPRRVASASQDRSAAPRPPRRAGETGGARMQPRSGAPRRIASGAQPPPSAAETATPRRLAATGQARRAERSQTRRRARPATRDTPGPAPAAPRRVAATGAGAGAGEAARRAPADRGATRAAPAAAPRATDRPTDRTPARAPADARAAALPPRDPAPRRSRARRDGPDRRLSDRAAAPLRDPDAVALEQMRALLADLHGAPCHMVLPLPEGQSGYAALGTERARLSAAGPRLDTALEDAARPVLATHPVSAEQCPVIDFAAASRDDPRRGLALDLWGSVASAGKPLTGTLRHEGGGTLHLLLIDTAGRVHDLTGFLRPVPGGSHFSIPMSGADLSGDTRQLLLAVATPTPLRTLPPGDGPAGAGALFGALGAELERLGLVPDLALAAFVFD